MAATCLLLAALPAQADITVTLSADNTGNYWWSRNQWMNGNDTSDGFSYGDVGTGLIRAQANYQYYGGADRYFAAADTYFQISLTDLIGINVESASFNFFVESQNTTAVTSLKHLTLQSTAPTGFAAQKLAGSNVVASSTSMVVGWNSIDVTEMINSDLSNSYDYAIFSIPRYTQVIDQNRLLQIYGSSAPDIEGESVKPYLNVVVPESATWGLLLGALALILTVRRRVR
jgi:hypothetical protein